MLTAKETFMSRSRAILALLLAGGIALVVRAQSGPPPTQSIWPPKPDQIFNLCESLTIPQSGTQAIYDVPWDKWLVVTDWVTTAGIIDLLEDNGGVLTQKLSYPTMLQGPSLTFAPRASGPGLVFHPRSKVVLRNVGAGPNAGVTILGYLAQP